MRKIARAACGLFYFDMRGKRGVFKEPLLRCRADGTAIETCSDDFSCSAALSLSSFFLC